jgi:hypothetical protein
MPATMAQGLLKQKTVQPESARVDHLNEHTRWNLLDRERIVNTAPAFFVSADAAFGFWNVFFAEYHVEGDL